MMSEYITFARPYAVALFEGSKTDAAKLLAWESVLQVLTICVQETGLLSRVANPKVSPAALITFLYQALESLVPSEVACLGEKLPAFLSLIVANRRVNVVPDLWVLYRGFLAAQQKVTEVEVCSAFELKPDQLLALKKALSLRFKTEIEIVSSTIDKSLIGGVVIRAKDFVLDGSIRNKLNRLSHSLAS